MNAATVGQLRALLHGEATPWAWSSLAALLDAWPDPEQLRAEILPYAHGVLRERWSGVRRDALQGWATRKDAPHPALALANALTLDSPGSSAALERLLGHPDLAGLETLRLIDQPLGDQGAAHAWGQLAATQLRELTLVRCDLGDDGLLALARSPGLASLQTLRVCHSRLSGPGAASLLRLADLAPLRELTLSDAPGLDAATADALMDALADSPCARTLTRLDLSRTGLSDAGARALARVARQGALPALNSLLMTSVGLGPRGARALARDAGPLKLHALELRGNLRMGDASAQALADSVALGELTRLDLGYTAMGDAGARALAQSPHLGALRELDLSPNQITDEGALAMMSARSLKAAWLTLLNLMDNPLSPQSLDALSERYPHAILAR